MRLLKRHSEPRSTAQDETRGLTTKFVYFAPADIQLPRVDRQCIVGFCSALAGLGVDAELVAIRIRVMPSEPKAADPLTLYRIRDRFKTRLIPVPVQQTSAEAWVAVNRLLAHVWAASWTIFRTRLDGPLVLFTKTYSTLWVLLAARTLARSDVRVVFEAHVPPRRRTQRLALASVDRIVANTHALAANLVTTGTVSQERVLGSHQGVDLELVDEARISKRDARMRLGLPEHAKLVVYTGKIHRGYREVEYLLAAARAFEEREEVLFVMVGGRADHVANLRARAASEQRSNVHFVGFVQPNAVLDYQFAADVLVMYYPSGIELNAYRSPGKLFEYMASGRPIVAVDLPVLREVLGQDQPSAVLVPPDSPAALTEALQTLLDDPIQGEELANRALERVRLFTWERRADVILRFANSSTLNEPTIAG